MSTVQKLRKALDSKTVRRLWVKSGGRCQYRGCNKKLLEDSLTKRGLNTSYIAHIVASSPKGARGDQKKSKELQIDYSNLMLLCDECHRRIDRAQAKEHSVELLRNMKREHERRIDFLTSLQPEKRSNIVIYGANIGIQDSPLTFQNCAQAILPQNFPAENSAIELGLKNSSLYDNEKLYWETEVTNLERQFHEKIKPLKIHGQVKHFSLFALAPQPLLIKLGTLFADISEVKVFQKHREPSTWEWQTDTGFDDFILKQPKHYREIPVLIISLSGIVTEDRVKKKFDKNISIWNLTHNEPNNNFLKSELILSKFRSISRKMFNVIKEKHGQNSTLHVFPAMPVSAAFEFGRVWMPKVDLKMIIYDQNKKNDGFMEAITIN